MAKHPPRADDDRVDRYTSAPAVHCSGCRFEWHSRAMAEGLALLGSCPKCGAELSFAETEPAHRAAESTKMDVRAPHLVLGVPRR